jgi:hypothetical protein
MASRVSQLAPPQVEKLKLEVAGATNENQFTRYIVWDPHAPEETDRFGSLDVVVKELLPIDSAGADAQSVDPPATPPSPPRALT